MNEKVKSGSRNVAIVGTYLSGKTTFLESLLFVTGGISRKGNVKDSNTVGDSVAESRDRSLSALVPSTRNMTIFRRCQTRRSAIVRPWRLPLGEDSLTLRYPPVTQNSILNSDS